MFERFKDRLPFSRWRPEILRDYCDYGVLPRDGRIRARLPARRGGVDLSEFQSRRVRTSMREVAQVQQPVVVMRAGTERKPGAFDLAASPTAPDLASRFAHGRDIVLPEASHFIPMEQPELVAEEIEKLPPLLLFEQCRPANPFALEHHQRDPLGGRDFLQRIAVHQQQVRVHALADRADVLRPRPAVSRH